MIHFKFMKLSIILFSILLFSCQEKNNKSESNNNRESDVNDTTLITALINENKKISEPPLSYLLKYSSKYEFESKLFDNEPLKSRLKKILGSTYDYFMGCCDVQTPIKIENEIVFIEGCQAHNCPGVYYVVYIDVKTDEIFVGLFDEGKISLYSERSNKYPGWLTNWKTEQEKSYTIWKELERETFTYNNQINKIGEEVNVGNFVYVVDKAEYLKTVENAFTSKTADGIYLLVYLTVLNTTRESRTLSNSMFKVFDSENYEYETSQNALTIMVLNDQDKVFLLKDIPPKIPKKIIMPFEIPTPNDVYTLQVSGGFWTGESAKIQLQN